MKKQISQRLFDILLAVILLIVLLPILLIALIISLWETKSFPIYSQVRGLTIDGKKFKIYKIRTVEKYPIGHETTDRKFLLSPGLAEKVPFLCRFLRLTGFDELPQVINVLKGEMSVIGPRPLDLFDLTYLKENYPELNNQREKLKCKGGILGLWQLFGNRELGAEDLLKWDIHYDNNHGFKQEIKILFSTLFYFLSVNKSKQDSIVKKS